MAQAAGLVVLNPAGSMFNFIDQSNNMLGSVTSMTGTSFHKASDKGSFTTHIAANPSVVLLADSGATLKKNAWMRDKVKKYMESGGTVILCGTFSSESRPSDMNALFKTFGRDWKSGEYYRTTHTLTSYGGSMLASPPGSPPLKLSYSCKAVNLDGAAREEALYAPKEDAAWESLVFTPAPANRSQFPAALSPVGAGYLAYIGDVNQERGSTLLVAALVKWASERSGGAYEGSLGAGTSAPARGTAAAGVRAGGTAGGNVGTGKTGSGDVGADRCVGTAGAGAGSEGAAGSGARPLGLVLLHPEGSMFELVEEEKQMLDYVSGSSGLQFQEVRAGSALAAQLARGPAVLLLPDNWATEPENAWLRDQVKQYMESGGTVVLCGTFSSETPPRDMDALLQGFGKSWKFGDYYHTTHTLTQAAKNLLNGPPGDTVKRKGQRSNQSLEASYSCKAVNLSGVSGTEALYVPEEHAQSESMVFAPAPANHSQVPAALSPVGAGYLAYVGDVNQERGSTLLIAALARWAIARHGCGAASGSSAANQPASGSLPEDDGGAVNGGVDEHGCGHCGRVADGMFRCAGCHAAWYCDAQCQRANWKEHRRACRASQGL